MTPYQYVHNNPVNLIDPTGMSADGWRRNLQTGEMSYDDSYRLENTPDGFEYGDSVLTPETIYNSDGTTTSNSNETVSCIECHHKTSFSNGSKSDLYGVVLYGNEATDFKAPFTKRNVDWTNIQGLMDLAAEFSPDVSKRLENANELFKYIDFSPKSNTTNNSKENYKLYKYIIASAGYSDYVKAYGVFVKDTFVDKKDVSMLNIYRQMDSMRKLPEVKTYNDSVELSIKNRFKK